MHTQSNPLAPSIDFFRSLGSTTLAGSQQMISWHFDQAQEFIGRSSKQMRETLNSLGKLEKPERWQETLGQGIRNSLEISRDYALSATHYQQESYALLQQQAIETQKKLSESLAKQLAVFQVSQPVSKRAEKATA